jgi:hypothetical protein
MCGSTKTAVGRPHQRCARRQSRDARRRRRSVANVDELGVALVMSPVRRRRLLRGHEVLADRMTREGQQALRPCRSHSPSGHQSEPADLFPDGRHARATNRPRHGLPASGSSRRSRSLLSGRILLAPVPAVGHRAPTWRARGDAVGANRRSADDRSGVTRQPPFLARAAGVRVVCCPISGCDAPEDAPAAERGLD